MYSFEVSKALHEVRQAALRSILTNDYGREEDPHADASAEHADEGLALAARKLVQAVEALPENQRPIGWDRVRADHMGPGGVINPHPRHDGKTCEEHDADAMAVNADA